MVLFLWWLVRGISVCTSHGVFVHGSLEPHGISVEMSKY